MYSFTHSSGEKLKAVEFNRRVIVSGRMGRVHSLRQDQEQTMDGKEEEVKEQQSPQKEEVGEHSRPKMCAQPLYWGVPQRQWVEKREAAEETVVPGLRQKQNKCNWELWIPNSTDVTQFGLTFEATTFRRRQHGIFVLKRELSGTSLKASFLMRRQEKRGSINREWCHIHFTFSQIWIYLISILSARQSGMDRSLLSLSLAERPRKPDSKCSSFPMNNKVGEPPPRRNEIIGMRVTLHLSTRGHRESVEIDVRRNPSCFFSATPLLWFWLRYQVANYFISKSLSRVGTMYLGFKACNIPRRSSRLIEKKI